MYCSHEFEVYNHGEVKCRICKKSYPLAWAVDKNNSDLAYLKSMQVVSDNLSINISNNVCYDRTINNGPDNL